MNASSAIVSEKLHVLLLFNWKIVVQASHCMHRFEEISKRLDPRVGVPSFAINFAVPGVLFITIE
jgi:hypothetical protein